MSVPARLLSTGLLVAASFAGGYLWRDNESPAGPADSSLPGSSGKTAVRQAAPDTVKALVPADNSPSASGVEPATDAAFSRMLSMPDRIHRISALSQWLATAGPAEMAIVDKVVKAWYQSGGEIGEDELGLMQYRSGQLAGAEAMKLEFPRDANGKLIQNNHRRMRGWASADPAAAKAWLDALDEGSVKQELKASWFAGAVSNSPDRAREYYAALPEGDKSKSIYPLIDSIHRASGFAGVLAWFGDVSTAPDSGVSLPEAVEKVAWRLGQQGGRDPEGVLAILRDSSITGHLSDHAFANATRHLATNQPGRVIDFLNESAAETLPETLHSRVRTTVENSTRSTLNNLGNWLNANPGHPLHDLTARYFVGPAAREDRESANAWAGKIKDPVLREEALQELSR